MGGNTSSRHPSAPGTVTLHCAHCAVGSLVPAGATFFICRGCGEVNNIFKCRHCGTVSIAAERANSAPTAWLCGACGARTQLPRFGRMPTQTAAEAMAAEELREVARDPEVASLPGFEVLSSTRTGLAVAGGCTVTVDAHGVEVRGADGHSAHRYPFSELTRFEVSGRTEPRRPRDGTGSLLHRGGPPRPGEEAVLRVAAGHDGIVLRHPAHTRRQLLGAFGPAIERWHVVHHAHGDAESMSLDEAIVAFERVVVQHERGEITEGQYVVQRALAMKRIAALGADGGEPSPDA